MAKQKYYQRPDGLYEAIRTINGKRKAFRGRSCREVDRKILEYTKEKERGRTVKQIADEWIEKREKELSDSSLKPYNNALKHLNEAIGSMSVKDVKPIHLDRLLLKLKDQGNRQGTVKIQKSVIRQVFRYAVIQGDIDVSPAAELELPRNLDHHERGSIPPEKIKAVLQYRGEGYLLGLFLLLTGCRVGEVLGLKYEDIDRKGKTISIRRKVSYATGNPAIEDHLKTEAGERTVPLLSPLEEAIPRGHLGLIFHEDGGGPLRRQTYQRMFRALCDGVGLVEFETVKRGKAEIQVPRYPYTAHWFRHTYATICYDAGLDPKSTASIMGHANERITVELYTHITKDREQVNAGKLEEYVSQIG